MAKIVLADIRGKNGFVNKDTIVGGFGARFKGTSTTTFLLEWVRRVYQRVPSLKFAHLAAILTKNGHEVVFTDGDVPAGDIAIVMSSIVDYKNERFWARKFKNKNKQSSVGFIGPCATYLPHLFENTADFIIQGEPEGACMNFSKKEDFTGIIQSDEIKDLDNLPFPDWDIFSSKYRYYSPGTYKVLKNVIPMVTSRSCNETCSYCPHRIGSSYRLHSIERIIEEIACNYKKMGPHYIIFRDSNFTRHKDRVEHFIDEISKNKFDISFEIETRMDTLDEELLNRLRKIGLKRITFGVESVDPEKFKYLGRRPIEEEQLYRMVNHCYKIGIQTQGFYIIGFPQDTIKSVIETIKYSTELNTTMASYKVLTPFPGTAFYDEIKDIIFEKDWEKFDGSHLVFKHPNITSEEMNFLLEEAYSRFYARPSQYFRYKGNYLNHIALSKKLDNWSKKKHDELFEKSLKKNNIWKEDFIWD